MELMGVEDGAGALGVAAAALGSSLAGARRERGSIEEEEDGQNRLFMHHLTANSM